MYSRCPSLHSILLSINAYILLDRSETNFFTGDPLRALTTLSYSDNVDLQRSAALAFAEITEKVSQSLSLLLLPTQTSFKSQDVREVARDTLEPILFLLQSHDVEVQRAASAALGNLGVNSQSFHSIATWTFLGRTFKRVLMTTLTIQPTINFSSSSLEDLSRSFVKCFRPMSKYNATQLAVSPTLPRMVRYHYHDT